MVFIMRIKAHVHWQLQRFSAMVLLSALPLLAWVFYQMKGAPYEQAILVIKDPLNFMVIFLSVTISLTHGFLGLQVIIRDYAKGGLYKIMMASLYLKFAVFLGVTIYSLMGIFLR